MSEELYHFYCIDLSNPESPSVTMAHSPLRGKEASYKEIRRLTANAKPSQIIIMRIPSGDTRMVNDKGEVVMLRTNPQHKALLKLLPAA